MNTCICGRPIPATRPGREPAKHCTYWCALVDKGTFTLEQVEPMLLRNRGPKPGGAA